MRVLLSALSFLILAIDALPIYADSEPGNSRSPQAVEEVKSGKRTRANAAWWGFDEDDVTDALQAAIGSGAKTLVIPNMGHDWIVRPLRLAGNQELILEEGVVIAAKRGEYREGGDSVFTARDIENLTIRGKGATIRMQKEDYIVGLVVKEMGWPRWFGHYAKGEWRMALAIRGCADVTVEGLTLKDSGGDGIYIDGGNKSRWSSRIQLKNVVCENNYRQGISVISVDGLSIADSAFRNTWGTPPSDGIDIEPDSPDHRLRNISVRNCKFEDNYGDGIDIHLGNLTQKSDPVSIAFEDCSVRSRRGTGIRVIEIGENGPQGTIRFSNCVVEETEGFGLKIQEKSARAAGVMFSRLRLRNVAQSRTYTDVWAPIVFRQRTANKELHFGGIEFLDCTIEDDRDRPALSAPQLSDIYDVKGRITVKNPHGVKLNLAATKHDVTLVIEGAGK